MPNVKHEALSIHKIINNPIVVISKNGNSVFYEVKRQKADKSFKTNITRLSGVLLVLKPIMATSPAARVVWAVAFWTNPNKDNIRVKKKTKAKFNFFDFAADLEFNSK